MKFTTDQLHQFYILSHPPGRFYDLTFHRTLKGEVSFELELIYIYVYISIVITRKRRNLNPTLDVSNGNIKGALSYKALGFDQLYMNQKHNSKSIYSKNIELQSYRVMFESIKTTFGDKILVHDPVSAYAMGITA